MARNIRNQVILAKIETTSGTDAVPASGTNAMLASKPKITPLSANNVDRDLVRNYFGASEQLVGTRFVQAEIEIELAGSGVLGTAPAFGVLLRACALAETIIAATRVDYTPITSAQESATLYWYDDGVLHKLLGARGTVKFGLTAGNRPTMMFMLSGLYSTPTAATVGATSFASFMTPQVVTDANSGDIIIGGSVSPTGAPAITGGTLYPSMGLDLDLGNTVQFNPVLGGEAIDITGRSVTGSVKLDLTAAQEVANYGIVVANTLQAVSFQHGSVGANKLIVHLPSAQLASPSKDEINGRRLIGYALRAVPTPGGSGNDELRLAFY